MEVGGCAHVRLVAMGRSPCKHANEVDTDHPTVSISAHALLAIWPLQDLKSNVKDLLK